MSLCFWGLEVRFCPQNGPFKKPCPEPIAISFPGTRGTSRTVVTSRRFCLNPRDPNKWIDEALSENIAARDAKWSQSIAVGSEAFVNQIVDTLGRA